MSCWHVAKPQTMLHLEYKYFLVICFFLTVCIVIDDIRLYCIFAWITGYCVNNMIKESNTSDYHWCVWFVLWWTCLRKSKALIMPMFRGWLAFLLPGSIIITMLMRFVFVLSVVITRGRLHSYIQWQARSLQRILISDFRTSKYCLLTCLGHFLFGYVYVLSQLAA